MSTSFVYDYGANELVLRIPADDAETISDAHALREALMIIARHSATDISNERLVDFWDQALAALPFMAPHEGFSHDVVFVVSGVTHEQYDFAARVAATSEEEAKALLLDSREEVRYSELDAGAKRTEITSVRPALRPWQVFCSEMDAVLRTYSVDAISAADAAEIASQSDHMCLTFEETVEQVGAQRSIVAVKRVPDSDSTGAI